MFPVQFAKRGGDYDFTSDVTNFVGNGILVCGVAAGVAAVANSCLGNLEGYEESSGVIAGLASSVSILAGTAVVGVVGATLYIFKDFKIKF